MSDQDAERQPLLGDSASPADPTPRSFRQRVHEALHNPKRLNGLEKALAMLAILLLLLTATGFGLFAGEATKLSKARRGGEHEHRPDRPTRTVTATSTVIGPTTTAVPPTHPPKRPDSGDVCLTPDCTRTAAGLLANLDTSIDPCNDFYNFANGGWLSEHPIPEGSAQYGTFQAITDRNQKIILTLLESPVDKSLSQADQHNLHNLKNFYASCTAEDTLDKLGAKPLDRVLETVIDTWRGETVVPELNLQGQAEYEIEKKRSKKHGAGRPKWDPKTKQERLTNALTFLHSRGIDALFSSYPEGDVGKNPKINALWLSQSGLSLPSKDYYDDKKTLQELERTIEAALAKIYEARKERSMNAKDLAKDVVKFEKELARISLDNVEVDDPIGTYNPYNSRALQHLFPSISFPNYFASFFPRPRYPDPVIVATPTFFSNLTGILDHVAPDALEAYFAFQTAQSLGSLLGSKEPIRREVEALSNRLVGLDPDAKKPRKNYCLDQVVENYGFLVGRYFVERAFPGESKKYAEEVIEAVIQAFRDRLPGLSWLDEATRDKAREKVDAISHKIGYPTENPNTEDAASLERYYSINGPIKSDEFLANVLRSRVAEERRAWVKIGRERGSEFDMVPSEVNAYYQPSSNEIVFPAGILQKPFFAVEWPEYLVYGAFGSVAGHELSHSLDQAGRLYDKDGKLTDWWSNATNARFEERKQCFVDQYSNYTIVGPDGKEHHVNGHFTDGEDTADSGGLAQTWHAWKTRLESDRKGTKYNNQLLPGLGQYSREQLFFIAFAQGWARSMTPAEAVRRIRVDPHSPTQFRVRGPLSNSEEFAKAWNCPVGSPMNNKHKCQASSSAFPSSHSNVSPWTPLPPTHSHTHDHSGSSSSNSNSQSGPDRVQSVLDRVLAQLDGFEDDMDCPLCLEEMDLSDLNFKPCPCGYQICRFCYHHIKENLNNRCPACRTPYDDASVEFKAIKPDEMKRLQAAKKLRDKRRKDEALRIQQKSDVRVRQRTQVHVQGMTTKIANEDTLQQLKGPESFGQYGKVVKLFMSKRSPNVTQPASTHPHFQPVNVYINYRTAAEASNCIAQVDGTTTEDGHKLKAIWGTTRYCPNYLKGIRCHNDSCTLAHEQGEELEGPAATAGKDEIFTYDNETASRVKTVLPPIARKQPEASLPATASWASKDAPRPPSTPIILNPHLPPLSATLPKPPAPRTISIGKPKNHPLPARPSSRSQREAANASASANATVSSSSNATSSSPTASPALAPSNPPSRSVSISLKTTSKSLASKSSTRTPPPEPEAAPEPKPPSPRAKSPVRPASASPPPPETLPPPVFTAEPEAELVFSAPPEFSTMPTFPEFGFGEGAFSFSLNLDVKGKGRAMDHEERPAPLRDFGNVEGFGRTTALDMQTSAESGPFSPGYSNTTTSSYIGSFDPFAEPSFVGGSLDLRSPSPSPPSTSGGEEASRRSSRFGFARRGSSTIGKNAGDLVSALSRSAFPNGLNQDLTPNGLTGGVPFAPPGIGLPPRSVAPSAAYAGLPPLGSSNENLWPSGSNPAFPPGVLRALASPNASAASSPQLSPHSRNGILPPAQGHQPHPQQPQHHFGPPPGLTGPPPSAANSALPPPPGIGLSRAPIPAASFPLPPPAPRPTNSNSSNVAKEDLLALIAAAQANTSKQQQNDNPPPHPFLSDPAILNARLAGAHPPQQPQGNGLGALGGGNGGNALDALFAQAQQQQQQQQQQQHQQQGGPFPPGMRPFGLPPQHQHQQGPPPPGMYRQGPPGIGKV
ncbi:CCR4-NOT core ubiquitin-protein ligase subunit MOT2 [Sporobolomyces koalae]|uniref:CCR4-NOT core ubiquitin-protein ligase subunit MOT2 n=1 Tax=Sporobolomyces koalae TaxID=500713 RepID=UPI00316CA976